MIVQTGAVGWAMYSMVVSGGPLLSSDKILPRCLTGRLITGLAFARSR